MESLSRKKHLELIQKVNDYLKIRFGQYAKEVIHVKGENLDDYISMAGAWGYTQDEIRVLLTENTDLKPWDIHERICQFFQQRDRMLWMDGMLFENITEASKETGMTVDGVKYRIKKGRAYYVDAGNSGKEGTEMVVKKDVLSKFIRMQRDARNLTRDQLAELTEVSPSTIKKLEMEGSVTTDILFKIMDGLEMDLFDFAEQMEVAEAELWKAGAMKGTDDEK